MAMSKIPAFGLGFIFTLTLTFTLTFALASEAARAQVEHALVRRITVFPVKTAKDLAPSAEEAWWAVREVLTENQRFLVASRNFLIQRDVFQPRSELKPADAVILGKLLDANAMVTTFLEDRVLSMRVYESEYGRVLWAHDFNLHPSLPISDQLVGAAKKMIYDFIASMPYQGFVVRDPLKGGASYKEENKTLAKISMGLNANVSLGDKVQFVRLYHDSVKPLFTPDTAPEVIAEGVVTTADRDSAVVEIQRVSPNTPVREFTLVRLPREFQRLRDSYALNQTVKGTLGTEYYSPEVTAVQQEVAERKPLVMSLAFIANLAAYLLLAF
jgi:hypothetical protein